MTVEIRGGSEAEKGANVRFRLANLRVMESQFSICAGRVPLRPVFGPDEDRKRGVGALHSHAASGPRSGGSL